MDPAAAGGTGAAIGSVLTAATPPAATIARPCSVSQRSTAPGHSPSSRIDRSPIRPVRFQSRKSSVLRTRRSCGGGALEAASSVVTIHR